jgi:hypothetical protein
MIQEVEKRWGDLKVGDVVVSPLWSLTKPPHVDYLRVRMKSSMMVVRSEIAIKFDKVVCNGLDYYAFTHKSHPEGRVMVVPGGMDDARKMLLLQEM